MNLKKYLAFGVVALGFLSMTSCIGDLDLQPNDPNLVDPSTDPDFKINSLMMCYTGIACSGYAGSGSSYIPDMDAGASAYQRLIYTLNEFCADEIIWIWNSDQGIPEITSSTWDAGNPVVLGAYQRIMGHIAICNQYLKNVEGDNDDDAIQMKAEARTLRAYSYLNMIDLFGQISFIDEKAENGAAPVQISRKDAFDWLENELKNIVDNKLISDKPIYGRVGLDGAEGLLAKLYLNAEVYTGIPRWKDCAERCQNIISRHSGGYENSGLAPHYLYVFSNDSKNYMPGGSKENEILFGIAFDKQMTQSYGGAMLPIAGCLADDSNSPVLANKLRFGTNSGWGCTKARLQMAERFYGKSTDVRDDLWAKGNHEDTGEMYSDKFMDFGDWKTGGGNVPIKFTCLDPSESNDGTLIYYPTETPDFPSVDMPIIRLADIYLMYAECWAHDNASADRSNAVKYLGFVRGRAGLVGTPTDLDLTIQSLMDERSRELYHEGWRRSDLVRNGMYAGPTQSVWQFKGSISNAEGSRIDKKYNLFPIPNAVIAAQPEFKQNPGY